MPQLLYKNHGSERNELYKIYTYSLFWIAPVFINIMNFRSILITRERFRNISEAVTISPLGRWALYFTEIYYKIGYTTLPQTYLNHIRLNAWEGQ